MTKKSTDFIHNLLPISKTGESPFCFCCLGIVQNVYMFRLLIAKSEDMYLATM